MRAATFSKSLTHRLHLRIELSVQRRHGLTRAKHSSKQRHQGPKVPTNLISYHFLLRTSTKVVNQHHCSLPLRHTTLSDKHIKLRQPLNCRVARGLGTAEETRQSNADALPARLHKCLYQCRVDLHKELRHCNRTCHATAQNTVSP